MSGRLASVAMSPLFAVCMLKAEASWDAPLVPSPFTWVETEKTVRICSIPIL